MGVGTEIFRFICWSQAKGLLVNLIRMPMIKSRFIATHTTTPSTFSWLILYQKHTTIGTRTKTQDPVCSPLDKPVTASVVIGSVTTGE